MSYVDKDGVRRLTRAEAISEWVERKRHQERVERETAGRLASEQLARAEHETAVAFARNHPTPQRSGYEPERCSNVTDAARTRMRAERLTEGWG
jgi:hypothetical protein